MGMSFEKALGEFEPALRLRAARANVISSNLANVDTPNYKARDFDFHSTLQAQMDQQTPTNMRVSKPGHISSAQSNQGAVDSLYRVPGQPSIDGNTVEEHVEHAEFMKNNLDFQTTFTVLNGRFKGLTKAIKGE